MLYFNGAFQWLMVLLHTVRKREQIPARRQVILSKVLRGLPQTL